jgi:hypothetical protein
MRINIAGHDDPVAKMGGDSKDAIIEVGAQLCGETGEPFFKIFQIKLNSKAAKIKRSLANSRGREEGWAVVVDSC